MTFLDRLIAFSLRHRGLILAAAALLTLPACSLRPTYEVRVENTSSSTVVAHLVRDHVAEQFAERFHAQDLRDCIRWRVFKRCPSMLPRVIWYRQLEAQDLDAQDDDAGDIDE